jgi:transposase
MNDGERSRVEGFRQLRKEIVGSREYLVVGIDVAKDRHHAFMGTATGKSVLRKLIFENSAQGFSELLVRADSARDQHGLSKVVFGMEPTGNYHKPLGNYLVSLGHQVVIVTGKAVKNNRQLIDGRWDKNDTKDAANIADLISRGRCLYYDLVPAQIDQLRDLLSLRRRLKKEEHGIRMRVRNGLLAKYFPEMDRFYNASESESLAIVRWCLSPEKIAQMPFEQFFRTITRGRRGIAQKLRLEKIHHLAARSVGCPMGHAADLEAGLLVEKLKAVRLQLSEVEQLMEETALDLPKYSHLLSIPGFGPYVASRVLAAIWDPFRFESSKQVLKMAGYDLCADRSGKRSDGAVPVISKNGNAELRYALYQAALIASTRDKHFILFFSRMLQGRERERGIKTKMRVKLAAKLLVIAWTLMKKGESFNPQYLYTQ